MTIVLQPRFKPTRPKFSTQLGTENKGRLVPAGIGPLEKWGSWFDQPQAIDYRRKVLDIRELQSIFPTYVNKDLVFLGHFAYPLITAAG